MTVRELIDLLVDLPATSQELDIGTLWEDEEFIDVIELQEWSESLTPVILLIFSVSLETGRE